MSIFHASRASLPKGQCASDAGATTDNRQGLSHWLVVHMAQIAACTLCFSAYIRQDVQHTASSLRHFYRVFLNEELPDHLGHRTKSITTPQALVSSLEKIQTSYFNLQEHSLTNYIVLDPSKLELHVAWRNHSETVVTVRQHDSISVHLHRLRSWGTFADIDHLRARIRLLDNFDGRARSLWASCYTWELQPTYEDLGSGELRLRLWWSVQDSLAQEIERSTRYLSRSERSLVGSIDRYGPPCWMQAVLFAIFVLAATMLVPAINGIREIHRARRGSIPRRKRLTFTTCSRTPSPSNRSSRLGSKVSTLPSVAEPAEQRWGIWSRLTQAVAGVVQILAVLQCSVPAQGGNIRVRLVLLGWACALSYFMLVPHLSFFDRWQVMLMTLKRAIPRCIRFSASVAPVYVGYVVLGVALWGMSDQDGFQSLGHSSATLFSLLNGDIVRDTFLKLGEVNWLIAPLYLYSFMSLFIYVVLNLVLAILEESFVYTIAGGHIDEQRQKPKDDSDCSAGSAEMPAALGVQEAPGTPLLVDLLTPSGLRLVMPTPRTVTPPSPMRDNDVQHQAQCADEAHSPIQTVQGRRQKLQRLQHLRAEIARLEEEATAICSSLLMEAEHSEAPAS